MSKRNRSGRGDRAPRHVRLYHSMMMSPAWQDLDAVARAIYIAIAMRYAGVGSNNGRIPYAVREGAAELGISPATVSRALQSLIDHGFIVAVSKGAFSLKQRHATEWRLTEFPCDVSHALSTKEFMRWKPADERATAPYGGALARRPPGLSGVVLLGDPALVN